MSLFPGYKECGTGERTCATAGGGLLGVFIGFFCPFCVPAVGAVFASIGLSIFTTTTGIYPLVGVFIVILLVGLALGVRRHQDLTPLLFAIIGAVALPLGRYVAMSAILAYTGAFCVIAAAAWNFLLESAPREARVTEGDVNQLLRRTTV